MNDAADAIQRAFDVGKDVLKNIYGGTRLRCHWDEHHKNWKDDWNGDKAKEEASQT